MEKLIRIFNNLQRGFVFCASTTILHKKLHTAVRPIILLPLEDVSEENIGKCELILDYKEKENVYNAITKNNKELKEKIDLTNNKYNEINKTYRRKTK